MVLKLLAVAKKIRIKGVVRGYECFEIKIYEYINLLKINTLIFLLFDLLLIQQISYF